MSDGWRKSRRIVYKQSQQELIRAFIERQNDGIVLLWYSEDPVEDRLTGDWRRAGLETCVWRVPPNANAEEMLAWLFLGTWTLLHCTHREAIVNWPMLQRDHLDVISESMRAREVDVMIDAFYDNAQYDSYVLDQELAQRYRTV
jgi:hypothetical protein